MSAWTHAAVCAALGIETRAGLDGVTYTGVSTDTRALQAGQLFLALRGEHHDAHAYLAQARERGAHGAVVDHVPDGAPADLHYYVVADTLVGLGRLARFHRRRMNWRVVAVAGANGKTTTKELLRAALGARYRVHATTGNLNNLIGAPLTLLSAPADTEVVIAEIGTNAPGEIAQLAAIVEADVGVITSIAAEHLEGLGDLAGVLREETSLLPWLPAGGFAAVAAQPPELPARARALMRDVVVCGAEGADAAYRADQVTLDETGQARFQWQGKTVQLRLRGRHNANNAMLALAVAQRWNVPADAALAALAELAPTKMRTELHRIGNMTVIADCYNANPSSVEAALDLLISMPRGGGRVAIVGSMLELGPESAQMHADTARAIADSDVDVIVATGDFVPAFSALENLGDRMVSAQDPLAAFAELQPRLRGDEVVLLKGSRGVALERLLPRFEETWGVLHPHGEAIRPRASSSGTGSRDDAGPAGHSHTFSQDSGE